MPRRFWRRTPDLPPLEIAPTAPLGREPELDPGDPVVPEAPTMTIGEAMDEAAGDGLRAIEERRFPRSDVPPD